MFAVWGLDVPSLSDQPPRTACSCAAKDSAETQVFNINNSMCHLSIYCSGSTKIPSHAMEYVVLRHTHPLNPRLKRPPRCVLDASPENAGVISRIRSTCGHGSHEAPFSLPKSATVPQFLLAQMLGPTWIHQLMTCSESQAIVFRLGQTTVTIYIYI